MDAAYLVKARVFPDDLASMSVLNFPEGISIPRLFTIKVSEDTIRGNHAHKKCWQIILAMNNSIKVTANFGRVQTEYDLSPLNCALIVPPLNWLKLDCPKDSVVLVLASEDFSENDYLRDFDEYIDYQSSKKLIDLAEIEKC
jgi:hypothetical protein